MRAQSLTPAERLARKMIESDPRSVGAHMYLAELLTSLTAFEQYSNECESRDTRDAELHHYLATAASHARHTIEDALSMVIDAENIDV